MGTRSSFSIANVPLLCPVKSPYSFSSFFSKSHSSSNIDMDKKGRQAAAGRSSTGSFTSAHADGCAEQCFEGVQFGSLFNVLKFFANSLPVCFPTLIWFALSEQGRSWRICRAARFYTVRTCLPYEVFKVQYGAVDQPGKALFFKGSFLADVHKTHGSGAERGMRRRLWA